MKLNWGHSILIFFAIFLSLATFFIIFSLRQNNDLVTPDYYEKGANYGEQIRINNRSAIYKDSLHFTQNETKLIISISKSLSQQVSEFEIYCFRPSDMAKDYRITSKSSREIQIAKQHIAQGRYKIHVSWKLGNEDYLISEDMMIN